MNQRGYPQMQNFFYKVKLTLEGRVLLIILSLKTYFKNDTFVAWKFKKKHKAQCFVQYCVFVHRYKKRCFLASFFSLIFSRIQSFQFCFTGHGLLPKSLHFIDKSVSGTQTYLNKNHSIELVLLCYND